MSQGTGSFPIVCSVSVSSHVAMRTERSAFLSGTSRTQEILLWGSPAILNGSLRGENAVLGLKLNMSLNEHKSNILGVRNAGYLAGGRRQPLSHQLIQPEKADKLLDST